MCFQLWSNRASYHFLVNLSAESPIFTYWLLSDRIQFLRIPTPIGFAFRDRKGFPHQGSSLDWLYLLHHPLLPLVPMEPVNLGVQTVLCKQAGHLNRGCKVIDRRSGRLLCCQPEEASRFKSKVFARVGAFHEVQYEKCKCLSGQTLWTFVSIRKILLWFLPQYLQVKLFLSKRVRDQVGGHDSTKVLCA